jgi:hypothetical protein
MKNHKKKWFPEETIYFREKKHHPLCDLYWGIPFELNNSTWV